MLRIMNFRLLGMVGLLCPGALGDTKCADVKKLYKEQACCGSPDKDVDVGSLCEVTSTLDEIKERGELICGVKDSQFGMGYYDKDTQQWSGLDIEYCKGVAAALGVDTKYVLASAGDRFQKLADKEIDVLIRTTTWTTERDVELKADFAAINFFDGQSILVHKDKFTSTTSSAKDLGGAKVCVQEASTSMGNVKDYSDANNLEFEIVGVDDSAQMLEQFKDGKCDAITGDKSAMVATKKDLEFETWITNELLSKEPLAAATRDNDAAFNQVVAWVWYGMVTAEEMNITGSNYESVAEACETNGANTDPARCRFLTENLGLGTTSNPLDDEWMQHVLGAVGNYGEAFSKAFCDGSYPTMNACLIERTGGNALVAEGGLQFAPAWRR